MKKQIACMIITTSLALLPVVFDTGCAVTQGQESAGAYATDKEIALKIKTAVYADPVVKGTQVEVKSLNGVVQLSGFVESEQSRQRAGEIAIQTKGVVQIYNNILLPTGK